jgi:hypothetical protein
MEAVGSGGVTRGKGQSYRCFLLRCRLDEGAGPNSQPAWRFTVQQAGPGAARNSFSRLKDVEAFLEAELASVAEAAGPDNSAPAQTAGEQRLA